MDSEWPAIFRLFVPDRFPILRVTAVHRNRRIGFVDGAGIVECCMGMHTNLYKQIVIKIDHSFGFVLCGSVLVSAGYVKSKFPNELLSY